MPLHEHKALLVLAVLAGIGACTTFRAPPEIGPAQTTYWSYIHSTSFVDSGPKAVLFGDGTAYFYSLCHPILSHPACVSDSSQFTIALYQLRLSSADLASVDSVYQHNSYFQQPHVINNPEVLDGDALALYGSTNSECNYVEKYPYHDRGFITDDRGIIVGTGQERNPNVVAIGEYMESFLLSRIEQGHPISRDQFLSDLARRKREAVKIDSLESCPARMFDALTRFFYARGEKSEIIEYLIMDRQHPIRDE